VKYGWAAAIGFGAYKAFPFFRLGKHGTQAIFRFLGSSKQGGNRVNPTASWFWLFETLTDPVAEIDIRPSHGSSFGLGAASAL
jgi:hypothetical protein